MTRCLTPWFSPHIGHSPWGESLTLGVAVFVSMLGVGIIVPILPVYAQDLGASATMVGLIFSSFSASRALVVPYVGLLSDRLGRKLFLELGLLGYAGLSVALIWTGTPTGLVVNRAFQGLFAAMILPVAMALVADMSAKGQEGRSFAAFNTWMLLGFGVGPLVGGVVYDLWGVRANFVLMALTSLVSLAMVWVMVREKPAAQRRNENLGWGRQLALIRDRPMLAVFLCRSGQALGMGIFVAFLPVLSAGQGVSQTQVGFLLAVNVLAMTLLQGPAGRLADRWPRLPLAGWGQAVSGLGKLLLPLADGFWGLLGLVVLEGVGAGMSLPALTAFATARGRLLGEGMGLTMGFFTLALSLGVLLGPIIGGWLADLWDMAGAFYLAGTATLLGAAALGWLGRANSAAPLAAK